MTRDVQLGPRDQKLVPSPLSLLPLVFLSVALPLSLSLGISIRIDCCRECYKLLISTALSLPSGSRRREVNRTDKLTLKFDMYNFNEERELST